MAQSQAPCPLLDDSPTLLDRLSNVAMAQTLDTNGFFNSCNYSQPIQFCLILGDQYRWLGKLIPTCVFLMPALHDHFIRVKSPSTCW